MEENRLKISASLITDVDKRGRPLKSETVECSTQPKSAIISQIIKSEGNPLEVKALKIQSECNRRGRPLKTESIKFSAQPKSAIISQILREKSLRQSKQSTSNNWQIAEDSGNDESQFQDEDDVKDIEIKVDVVYDTPPKRIKVKEKSKRVPKLLKVAVNKQEKLYACDYPNCSYAARLSCNLVKHKRIHTSEKPYICDQCPFRTNFINSLKVHRRIHTAEKPYSCECCGYRCNTSSNLKKHRLHRHPEVAKI